MVKELFNILNINIFRVEELELRTNDLELQINETKFLSSYRDCSESNMTLRNKYILRQLLKLCP